MVEEVFDGVVVGVNVPVFSFERLLDVLTVRLFLVVVDRWGRASISIS